MLCYIAGTILNKTQHYLYLIKGYCRMSFSDSSKVSGKYRLPFFCYRHCQSYLTKLPSLPHNVRLSPSSFGGEKSREIVFQTIRGLRVLTPPFIFAGSFQSSHFPRNGKSHLSFLFSRHWEVSSRYHLLQYWLVSQLPLFVVQMMGTQQDLY